MRHRLLLASILLTAACAARGPSPQVLAEMAKADSLLRQGCYTCLKEARAIYEKQAIVKRPPLGAAPGAFDAALLIAIRERELGIPGDFPNLTPPDPGRQLVLEAAKLIIGETSGLDPEQRAARTGRVRPPLELDNATRRALDPVFSADLVATYVALTIDCEQQKLIEGVDLKVLTAKYNGVPLMKFRLARCGRPPLATRLAELRAADPRWTDTLFWEGRAELVTQGQAIDFPKAIALMGEGRQAFPKSLMLTMAWSQANISVEEFEAALSGFDEVLAGFPEHRDAMIGRVTALSYLLRHTDAIASATRILELGTWHIGDANYWRAWNHYNIKEYERAWTDVENARKGLSNSRVYMLAGLIAYARKELPTAINRFDVAFQMDSSACDAVWMSGLVSIDQEDLKTASPKFQRSMTCFVSSAAALRRDVERTEGLIAKRGTPASARERRVMERTRRDAENADERSAQSAFNAAQCLARLGNKGLALNLVDVAITHPKMSEKALALKAAIEKLPN